MPDGQDFNPVQELKTRYPAISSEGDLKAYQYLSNPTNFRAVFPEYAQTDDATISRNMKRFAPMASGSYQTSSGAPVQNYNQPDTNSGGVFGFSPREGETTDQTMQRAVDYGRTHPQQLQAGIKRENAYNIHVAAPGAAAAGLTMAAGPEVGLPAKMALAALGGAGGEAGTQLWEHGTGQDTAPQTSGQAAKQIGTVGALTGAGEGILGWLGRKLFPTSTQALREGTTAYQNAVTPGSSKLSTSEAVQKEIQGAAPYLAQSQRAMPMDAGEGVAGMRDAARGAGDALWRNAVEPYASEYGNVRAPANSVADRIVSDITPMDRAMRGNGRVAAADSLADFYRNKVMSLNETLDHVNRLNNDPAIERYYRAPTSEAAAQMETGDPALRAKLNALEGLRDQAFNMIERVAGSPEEVQSIRQARAGFGSLQDVTRRLNQTQVPTPATLGQKLINSVRYAVNPKGTVLDSLFSGSNPNKMADRAMSVFGRSDLQPPQVVPPTPFDVPSRPRALFPAPPAANAPVDTPFVDVPFTGRGARPQLPAPPTANWRGPGSPVPPRTGSEGISGMTSNAPEPPNQLPARSSAPIVTPPPGYSQGVRTDAPIGYRGRLMERFASEPTSGVTSEGGTPTPQGTPPTPPSPPQSGSSASPSPFSSNARAALAQPSSVAGNRDFLARQFEHANDALSYAAQNAPTAEEERAITRSRLAENAQMAGSPSETGLIERAGLKVIRNPRTGEADMGGGVFNVELPGKPGDTVAVTARQLQSFRTPQDLQRYVSQQVQMKGDAAANLRAYLFGGAQAQ